MATPSLHWLSASGEEQTYPITAAETMIGRKSDADIVLGNPEVSLRERQSDAHAVPYDRYAVGIHHVAFVADERGQVDERAAWLREHGAEIESGPEEYDYAPGYYAVFFYDPDGLKLEIVHRP